jgi:hypothetical protein
LKDAGVSYDAIESAFVGYVYGINQVFVLIEYFFNFYPYTTGDSTSGQRALYELGMTGIPIVNVNNNCSTGASALLLAKNSIEGGLLTSLFLFENALSLNDTRSLKQRTNELCLGIGL